MKKGNNKTRLLSAAITLSLLLSLTSVPSNANTRELSALADTNSAMDVDGRVYPYLKGISNKNVWAHNRFSVVIGGRTLSVKGVELNGVAYLPFRAAAGTISGSSYSYNSQTRTSVMRAPGLEITVSDGGYVTYANGRALFNTTPCVIMSDGRLYIPVSVFAKAVGMTVGTEGGNIRLSGSFKPLLHADKFYNKGYRKASDVAREIFEEIEKLLAMYSHLHRYAEEAQKVTEEYADGSPVEMTSVWDACRLEHNGYDDYETMCQLQDNIGNIEKSRLLKEFERDIAQLKKKYESEGADDAFTV